MTTELKQTKRILSLTFAIIFLLGVDIATKISAEHSFMSWAHSTSTKVYEGKQYPLWTIGSEAPDDTGAKSYVSLNLNYVRNHGIAWGAFSNLPDHYGLLLLCLATSLVLIFVGKEFLKTSSDKLALKIGFALIFVGGLGNLANRIYYGYVIDWIDVHWRIAGWQYHFPNFNIADIFVNVGLLLILIQNLSKPRSEPHPT